MVRGEQAREQDAQGTHLSLHHPQHLTVLSKLSYKIDYRASVKQENILWYFLLLALLQNTLFFLV